MRRLIAQAAAIIVVTTAVSGGSPLGVTGAQAQPSPAFRGAVDPRDYVAITRRMVEGIFISTNRDNQSFINYHSQLYAPTVDYHGRFRSQAEVMEDKVRWAERWPVRNYLLQPGSGTVFCDYQRRLCEANVDVAFTAVAPERDRRSGGTWRARFDVDFSAGRPLIVHESGFILNRQ